MQYGKTLLAAGLLLSLTTLNAQASLTAYTAAGNQSVVYSSVSNVTWTGDANLLGTMINSLGYTNVVNAIRAASLTVTNTPNSLDGNDGVYLIGPNDFSNTFIGRTTWFGAVAFTKYLNSINYAGSNQWALPGAGANPHYGFNQTGGQFGQLFYNELGGTARGIIPNTANFSNEQAATYWLGTEDVLFPSNAWLFLAASGGQELMFKNVQTYAWAVSPGQVAAVPVPGAVWLFGSGLLGLIRLRRRG